ncbi:MAG: iron ABC transporter permease [Clostridia bacterium]|nr:iron ABC transporter permease [Clostridia bacterium]
MNKNKITLYFAAGILLLAVTLILSLLLGSTDISIAKALSALADGNTDDGNLRIFLYVRIPRITAAVFAGVALSVSGVLIQAVLANPMASPNIIGVNAGAGFAVILASSLLPNMLAFIPLAAFLGAVITCLLIFVIAKKTCSGRMTIILVGIAVTSILNAAISAVKTVFPNSVYNFTTFSVGGLGAVNISVLRIAVPVIVFFLLLVLFLSKDMDILCLGEETAFGLGMRVSLYRFIFLISASALAGCAVSFAGLLGFVGLVVPHIARRFVGTGHRLLVPLSAILGAEFVLLSDLFCRIIFRPYEIPVGILLSFVGGIFFIFLILMQRKGKHYD